LKENNIKLKIFNIYFSRKIKLFFFNIYIMETINKGCSLNEVLAIIVIVAIAFWAIPALLNYCKIDGFDGAVKYNPDLVTVLNKPGEFKQEDIPAISPPSYDADTLAIQSGSAYLPQKEFITPWGTHVKLGDFATADGSPAYGADAITDYTLNFNQCSPACCSDQWPVPFKLPVDKMLCDSEDKFVPSTYVCNNGWQNSGCLCMTQQQSDFLQMRGTNSDY
jgi:hypothetical protein